MFFNNKKFNKEIQTLKNIPSEQTLGELQKERLKFLILAKIKTQVNETVPISTWRFSKWQYYVVSIISGLTVLGGTAFAANNSKPGDILFPVKKVRENIQLGLTFSDTAKADLKIKFAQERAEDLNLIKFETQASSSKSSFLINPKKVKDEAQTELDNALNGLEQDKQHFETRGNTTTAAHIDQAISQIKIKVHNEHHEHKDPNGNQKNSNFDDQEFLPSPLKASQTPETLLPTPIELTPFTDTNQGHGHRHYFRSNSNSERAPEAQSNSEKKQEDNNNK